MNSDKTTGAPQLGRPRGEEKGEMRFWDGELYALLKRKLPHHVQRERLVPASLADALGVARFTVYRWLNEQKISQKGARKLIAESRGKLKAEDLTKFLFS